MHCLLNTLNTHVRICLYRTLDALGEDVLYHDTGSVIFEERGHDDKRFVGVGLNLGKLVVKCKGFSSCFTPGIYKKAETYLTGEIDNNVLGFALCFTRAFFHVSGETAL